MPITRTSYQLAHITIVVAYTIFCVVVLGVEHPIIRMVAAIAAAIPVLWAIWTVAAARVPPETMSERLREELKHDPLSPRYRTLTDELLAIVREARNLDRLGAELEKGELSREAALRRLGQIENRMKRRVERMGELISG